jgi:allose-binding protein
MNKYLKYFSGAAMGLMLSTSAFAAAEYAVVLKHYPIHSGWI